jgi:outer membrane lipoprotein-sorting protein
MAVRRRIALVLMAASLRPHPARAEPAAASSPVSLADLMRTLASVAQRQATFSEQKHLAALDRPLVSSGELHYRRPAYLEKLTLVPKREELLVDGGKLIITDPTTGADRVVDLAGMPEVSALVDLVRGTLAGDLAALQSHYRVTAEGTAPAWRLSLIPTEARLAGFIKLVRIDGEGTEPRIIDTIQANGDWSRMTIDPVH